MPDFTSEGSAADEVGVEEQSPCLRAFVHLYLDHLAGGEAGHRAFLVVVGLPSVADVAATCLFQEQGVDAIVHGDVGGETGGFFQVYDADQRVQAFQAEELVILLYCIQFDNFFHGCVCKSLQIYTLFL